MAFHVNKFDDVLASSYFGKMFATLQKFREESTFCDTVIQGSCREFKAHSVVLAAASSVLKSTLQKDGSPGITHRIKLQEVEDNVIENALHYIYTGELLLPRVFVSEMSALLVALDKLGLEPHRLKVQLKSEYNKPGESGSVCDTNLSNGSESEHSLDPSNVDCGNMADLTEHCPAAKVENVSESAISPTILDNDKTDHTGTCESFKTLNSNPKMNVTLGNKCHSVDSVRKGRDRNKPLKLERMNAKRHKNVNTHVEKFKTEECKMSNITEETPTKHSTLRSEIHSEIVEHEFVKCEKETAIKKKHACTICQKSFTRKHHLTEHSLIHTGAKPYACSECGKGFNAKTNMKRHLRSHSGLKPHLCDFCGRGFARKLTLQKHAVNHKGLNTTFYKCDSCNKSFNLALKLKEHVAQRHGNKYSSANLCDTCGRRFSSIANLKAHSMGHTGEKPYVCNVCEKKFVGKVNLEQHLRIHTQEKPYVCDICAKCFRHKHGLTFHMFVHTGEKPYECKVCRKTYRQPQHLKSHMLTHTGEKPYVCSMCEKAYKHRLDLRFHSLRIHKIDITLRIQTEKNNTEHSLAPSNRCHVPINKLQTNLHQAVV